jgi:hypothetical protein
MTPTNEPEAPTFAPSNRDPQLWRDDEIAAGLNSLPIPECALHVVRADRHDRTSKALAVRLVCPSALTYDAITQIAGLFETPHITFTPHYRARDGAPIGDCTDVPCGCVECIEPYTEIMVKWEAP